MFFSSFINLFSKFKLTRHFCSFFRFFDKLGGALDSDRPNSRNSNLNKSYDYLDDIESASQVYYSLVFYFMNNKVLVLNSFFKLSFYIVICFN